MKKRKTTGWIIIICAFIMLGLNILSIVGAFGSQSSVEWWKWLLSLSTLLMGMSEIRKENL